MKIVIMTVGSAGDIAPYTGLAARLQAEGHDVAIAAQLAHEDMVKDCGAEFRLMPGDLRALLLSKKDEPWQRDGTGLRRIKSGIVAAKWLAEEIGGPAFRSAVLDAAKDADLLMLHFGALVHGHLAAKALGVKSVVLQTFPCAPTREFLLPLLGSRSLGPWLNLGLSRLVMHMPTPLDSHLKNFCRELGLPPAGYGQIQRKILNSDVPFRHGYSPVIVPHPKDWRTGIETDGFWWPHVAASWEPPAELVDFLAAGPPPVFIGFGSSKTGDGARVSEIVSDVVRRTGVRAVVQSGWCELSVSGDQMLSIGSVPHEWLFPQMSVIVHHGGPGTTGASLRAGVPVVTVPTVVDQPFWAARLTAIGVSPGSLSPKNLAAEPLAELIRRAPAHSQRAAAVGEMVRAEDGAGRIVSLVNTLAS